MSFSNNTVFLLKIRHENNNIDLASPTFQRLTFSILSVCAFYSRLQHIRVTIFAKNQRLFQSRVPNNQKGRIFRRNTVAKMWRKLIFFIFLFFTLPENIGFWLHIDMLWLCVMGANNCSGTYNLIQEMCIFRKISVPTRVHKMVITPLVIKIFS